MIYSIQCKYLTTFDVQHFHKHILKKTETYLLKHLKNLRAMSQLHNTVSYNVRSIHFIFFKLFLSLSRTIAFLIERTLSAS